MNGDSRERSPADAMARRDYSDTNGYATFKYEFMSLTIECSFNVACDCRYVSIHQKRKIHGTKTAVPRTNYTINYTYANSFKQPQFEKPFDDVSADLQVR